MVCVGEVIDNLSLESSTYVLLWQTGIVAGPLFLIPQKMRCEEMRKLNVLTIQ